jgi:NAD-dependent deacetylase
MELNKKNIVVLTGAGISSESGLKTFRDADGLWEGHRVEDVATPEAFRENPELVYDFYNQRRRQLKEVKPNQAHLALAEFERNHNAKFTLITQNVDNLHELARSQNIIHMHGELQKVRCMETDEVFPWTEDLDNDSVSPTTQKSGTLRPHICWFGEMPYHMVEIGDALRDADIFVAIGTSGLVYPAAGFVQMVSHHCHKVLINKDAANNNPLFHEVILGNATQEVPKFFQQS